MDLETARKDVCRLFHGIININLTSDWVVIKNHQKRYQRFVDLTNNIGGVCKALSIKPFQLSKTIGFYALDINPLQVREINGS